MSPFTENVTKSNFIRSFMQVIMLLGAMLAVFITRPENISNLATMDAKITSIANKSDEQIGSTNKRLDSIDTKLDLLLTHELGDRR